MFTSKEEKERRVIDLYSQGKTYRHIAEEARISPNDIHTILKKKEESNDSTVTNNQQQRQELSSKAYRLFSKKKRREDVAIELNLRESEMTRMFIEYCRLKRLDKLISIYKATKGRLGPFLKYTG